MSNVVLEENITEFGRLSRDIRDATRTLEKREARYLVDLYYQVQHYRIASKNQERSMEEAQEPHSTITFFGDQMRVLENQIQRVLGAWTDNDPLGSWAKSITGIGPVIAAGLLAHIDINKAPTAGHIWRYAGLDPTSVWRSSKDSAELATMAKSIADTNGPVHALEFLSPEFGRSVPNLLNLSEVDWEYVGGEGEDEQSFVINGDISWTALGKKLAKRPWNASLKVVCWKAGESFVKVSANKNDVYGKFYVQRKQYEIERNERVQEVSGDQPNAELPFEINGRYFVGGNAKAASETLKKKRIGKDTDAYKSYSIGKLPPAHLHARAKRYAVKLFLAHYQEVGYRLTFHEEPPAPYPIAILGHSDRIYPPNAEGIS